MPMSPKRPPESEEPVPGLDEPEPTEPALVAEGDDEEELEIAEEVDPQLAADAPVVPAVRVAPRPSPTRPWGGNRGAISPEDLSPEELTPEMRWPPGSWVKVNDIVRHSTGEVIESISVGDVGQVIAALSQTLVVLFPTRDNRREVVHIDSIEAVEKKPNVRR
ncbi:MAG TPA: hypothetical protein VNH38_06660 [Candidatus Dormibacteraeota bacterium]|nr:hypothetical protein [Candidatus Dormibacteraeota bacterium]